MWILLIFMLDYLLSKAISLEILDRPKDQRPKIMGFGTVVEHLPIQERPIPVKPILASPAFPSRSKKRPRAASSSAKTSSSRPRTRCPHITLGADVKRAKTDDEDVYQGDGEFEEGDNKASVMGERGIFNRSTVYYLSGLLCSRHVLQMDGQSNSDSDLTIDNESNRSDLMESGACSDNDSELLSSGSSSSESGSENDVHSNKFSSSKKRSSESGAEMKKVNQRLSRRVPRTNAAERLPVKSEENRSPPVDRTVRQANARVDSRSANLPSEVVELMRTDQAVEVNAKGTPDELNIMECGFRHPSNYARARVWLPEITDWCLDYAEGDPTLWVITPHAWYKIAGPLSGLLPHPSYRHVFEHVRLLFEASYLVAYVLKEWLPINKKVSYRATLQQIIELSLKGRYRVVGIV
ncbi:hypothetical protein PsorP6_003841 [Peronosclerospora sorghi]|uniref:Uncharacterized protein n=1 Tax=Peronosclerospora sorghi TaxID=230839 RepID=A0ACC0VP83_9STRA|nr:hypothetical protein PsorP6_003841 [Peronosclerospora sorghi]